MFNVVSKTDSVPVETITQGFIDNAIKYTKSTLIKEKIAYNFIKKGWVDIETENYKKALKHFNRSLKIFIKRENLDGYLLSSHGIASIYSHCHEYSKALEIYYDILNRLETRDSELRFITIKDIANTYYCWGVYREAIKYLKMAESIIKKDKSVYRKIYINLNLGKAYLKLNKINLAQEAFYMCLTLCDSNNINYKISEALTNQGKVFRRKHIFLRAENFHIRALQYTKSARDFSGHIDILNNMGSLCYYAGEYKKGINFLLTALEEMELIKKPLHKQLKSHRLLYLCYKELGLNEDASKHLNLSFILKEEEKDRIIKLQNELLNVKMKFDIDSESFILRSSANSKLLHKHPLNREETIHDLAVAIYGGVKNLLMFKRIALYTLKGKGSKLMQTVIFENGKTEITEIDGKGLPGYISITQNKEIILYNRKTEIEGLDINKSRLTKDMNSFMVLPLHSGGGIVGSISIEDIEESKYTQFDLNTLKTISAYITLSIENMRVKGEVDSLNNLLDHDTVILEADELKEFPQKDQESGFPQLYLFTELLKQLIKETKRSKGKISLFSIEVEMIIEKRGTFLSEDLAMSEHIISEKLRDSLRAEDVLGKPSSNSYLLAIKPGGLRGCKTVAKKLVDLLKVPIYTENQKIIPRVMIGIALYPENSLTAEDLIQKAGSASKRISKGNSSGFEFYDSIHNITTID